MVLTCTSKTQPAMAGEIKSRASYWARRLECPVDEDANYRNTFWCNRDLIPIPEDRRTWTWQGFAGYWVICGCVTRRGSACLSPSRPLATAAASCSASLTNCNFQHQHDGMDSRIDAAVSWPECTSGHRLHGRGCFDLCSGRCARRMAREPSLLGFHGALPSFLGHARWFLASP